MVATQSPDASPEPKLRSSTDQPKLTDPHQRLAQIERELQRWVRRKLKGHEITALRHAALAALRYEMAALSGKAGSDDIVRLFGAVRRAKQDFAALVGIKAGQQQRQPDMREIEAELSHAAR